MDNINYIVAHIIMLHIIAYIITSHIISILYITGVWYIARYITLQPVIMMTHVTMPMELMGRPVCEQQDLCPPGCCAGLAIRRRGSGTWARTARAAPRSWCCGTASGRGGRMCPATRTSPRWTGTWVPPGNPCSQHLMATF